MNHDETPGRLHLGQAVCNEDNPEVYGYVARADMDELLPSIDYYNCPFFAMHPEVGSCGQEEMTDETTEVCVEWKNGPLAGKKRWEWSKFIMPADEEEYEVLARLSVKTVVKAVNDDEARDKVIEILTGALRDSGWEADVTGTGTRKLPDRDLAA